MCSSSHSIYHCTTLNLNSCPTLSSSPTSAARSSAYGSLQDLTHAGIFGPSFISLGHCQPPLCKACLHGSKKHKHVLTPSHQIPLQRLLGIFQPVLNQNIIIAVHLEKKSGIYDLSVTFILDDDSSLPKTKVTWNYLAFLACYV